MLLRAILEFLAADEAQFAIFDREYRRRPRQPIDHSEFTDDRAGTEHGQNPLVALRRGYDDLEQALLEPIATITGVSRDEQRFAGLTATRRGVAKELRRQGVRQARRDGGALETRVRHFGSVSRLRRYLSAPL